MNGTQLRHSLRTGQRVYGTLVVSESPLWPRAVAQCGLDFVFLDTEHTALTRTQVAGMCQLYSALGIAPLVRLPSPDPNAATNAIDTGAAGIVAPYVESAEVVRELSGAVRLRPLKGRRRTEILAGDCMESDLDSYLRERNDAHCLVVNIESIPALENLDEILTVRGLDAVLVGPHDLSCSLGIPEQYDHPKFVTAVESVFVRARANGIGAGIHYTGEVAKQIDFLKRGANMMIHCADISLFARHLTQDVAAMKTAMEDDVQPTEPASHSSEHL